MRRFGELPEDLDKQDASLGPPPPRSWWNQGFPLPLPGFLFGDVEEVNMLTAIKKRQAYPKNIPLEAARYTDISPVSPFFRTNIAKYGFGEIKKGPTLLFVVLLIGLWHAL